ncbi:MAG: SpoIVB peptidase [Bacillota bacterium]
MISNCEMKITVAKIHNKNRRPHGGDILWKKIHFRYCFCMFVFAVILPIFAMHSLKYFLPNDLLLVEGQITEISSKLPISAKTDEESIGVIQVETASLADAFSLDLGTTITAEPVAIGEADITFYLCNSLPIKTVSARVMEEKELIPIGYSVGITLDTDGLLVLGTGQVAIDDSETPVVEPAKGVVKVGDLLLEANGVPLINKEAFQKVVLESEGEAIDLLLVRNDVQTRVELQPVYGALEEVYKVGIWVRDSIQGIGTITYYDPKTEGFGALGHGIFDVDTGDLMPMKEGSLIGSNLTEIVRGEKGTPGELTGSVSHNETIGTVEKNTPLGIYGTMDSNLAFGKMPMKVATKQEVELGAATILSNIEGEEIKSYDVEILNLNGTEGKEIKLEVTDEELIAKTGGIVQGMSGSPILQNGKIVGAVTHVFVNEPTRGYGIFIENMLQAAE